MPLNQQTAENAYLLGKNKFELWKQQWQLQWAANDIESSMRMTAKGLKNLPETMRAQVESMDPEAWKSVDNVLNTGKAGKNGRN